MKKKLVFNLEKNIMRGLLYYFPLNGDTSNLSVYGKSGNIQNPGGMSYSWEDGKVGKCLRVANGAGRITLATGGLPAHKPVSKAILTDRTRDLPFTLQVWGKLTEYRTHCGILGYNGFNSSVPSAGFIFSVVGANKKLTFIKYAENSTTNYIKFTANPDINLNTLNHIIIYSNGTDVFFKINGVDVGKTVEKIGTYTFMNPGTTIQYRAVCFGGVTSSNYQWVGDFEELALWDRVLTEVEQQWLWNNGNGRPIKKK